MEPPIPAYRGDEDYVFICYSHQDAAPVYAEIGALAKAGFNIWYDEGIRPGVEWTAELASAISQSSRFLYFATRSSVDSRHCRDEIQFALNHNIPLTVVMLEDVELPPGLELILGSIQAIRKFDTSRSRYREQLREALADSVVDTLEPRSPPPARRSAPRRTILAAVCATLLIAMGWAAYQLLPLQMENSATQIDRSIALLPFDNNGGFDDPYYAESLAEDLLNRLVSIEGLLVASRRASFAHAERTNLVDIARDLRVANIVTGTIRRSTSDIRMHLELVDVSAGNEVVRWSQTFTRQTPAELLSVLTQTTQRIADEFFPAGVGSVTRSRLQKQSTNSEPAFELYLRAKAKYRNPASANSVNETAALYEEALALDPNFAWAQAGLCQTYLTEYARERIITRARPACEALTKLDPELFEVRLALGHYYAEIGELEKAIVELEAAARQNARSAETHIQLARAHASRFYALQEPSDRTRAHEAFNSAIEADPDHWGSYHSYAIFLTRIGELEDAMQQLHRALQKQPDNMPSLNNLANIQYRLGQVEQAKQTWQRSLAIDDANIYAHSGLGILHFYAGNAQEAITHQRRSTELSPMDHRKWGHLGEAYAAYGARDDTEQALSRAIELAEQELAVNPQNWEASGLLARYYALLQRHDKAADYIELTFRLNPAGEPMTHYWAALVAIARSDIEQTFSHLEQALKAGLTRQGNFIVREPLLADLREEYPQRFAKLIEPYI
ncbi:MAG: tetratricopeptide repeat protein [Pseudomonadales bacterium]